jgi:hypothetical protein
MASRQRDRYLSGGNIHVWVFKRLLISKKGTTTATNTVIETQIDVNFIKSSRSFDIRLLDTDMYIVR